MRAVTFALTDTEHPDDAVAFTIEPAKLLPADAERLMWKVEAAKAVLTDLTYAIREVLKAEQDIRIERHRERIKEQKEKHA